MSLKVKLTKETLEELIGYLKPITSEPTLQFSEEGFRSKHIDYEHVSILALKINASTFNEYVCSCKYKFKVDLEKLEDINKLVRPAEMIQMTYSEDKPDYLLFDLGYLSKRARLETAESDPNEPNIKEYSAQIRMDTQELRRAVLAASALSDCLTLTLTREEFKLEADEASGDNVRLNIPKDKLDEFNLRGDSAAIALYSIDYFLNFIKAIKAPKVDLQFGTDYPIKIRAHAFNGNGKASYILAPRIEE